MSKNHSVYRALTVTVLLSALVVASRPAEARPIHRPASKVAALGESTAAWVRNLLGRLWLAGTTKEGVTIDPDGAKSPEGVTVDPNGGLNDEGMSIDPDGRS
ncbi:MAG TPA: hypothetical protein VHC97_19760 [Thermoanaerobaculia bacterium]|jgi:hypothetical protein|nr:hypothetical protein [Thermoanaerobaculia bacterium]